MASAGENNHRFYVVAAVVASELDKAQRISKQITLTASNARALAQRAGQGAAGFKAVTDFIDELAHKTVVASKTINNQAVAISRIGSQSAHARSARERFEKVYQLAADAPYIHSIDVAYEHTRQRCDELDREFQNLAWLLKNNLEELARELRTATVLSAMSRVEASHSGKEYEQSLNVIADNVAKAASEIDAHVKRSQQMFLSLAQ